MLSKPEMNQRHLLVLTALGGLSQGEAMAVLGGVMQELAGQPASEKPRSTTEELITRRSRLKVEKDPEIRDLVHSLSREPVGRIAEECKARFGDRAPSKSAIYSYIKRLERRRTIGE